MKRIAFILITCWVGGLAIAVQAQWLESVPQALEQAKRENKLVLLDFTGSDWCGWCMKLDSETLSKPDFLDYAKNNLVLVRLDYPAHKEQFLEVKNANRALKEKYQVSGYPTLIALKPDGAVAWKQTGFLRGGPAALITKLDEVRPAPGSTGPVPWSAEWSAQKPAEKKSEKPRLQGIFCSSSKSFVLLDGQTCGEGDAIHGMKVLKITPEKVTVQWLGKTNELRMN